MELYIHIPFCVRKCAYCAFCSLPGCSVQDMSEYLRALLREARMRKAEITEEIETVYIGGGTPSLIPSEMMRSFLSELRSIFNLSAVHEFSAEANPGTISMAWLNAVRDCGVNRLSLGMQASSPRLLHLLGRIHTLSDVTHSVTLVRKNGFANLNLDLIFGIPGQTMEDWKETVSAALSLHPEHISAYGLIPEEGTPLQQQIASGMLTLPDPDLERDMYDYAIQRFHDAGLLQYEISNFAREGFECRHNIGYWNQIPYLGLGLSAASMLPASSPKEDIFSIRHTNPDSFSAYYEMLDDSSLQSGETDCISRMEARFETVMLSLRMTKGMDRERFRQLHGNFPEYYYENILYSLEEKGLLILRDNAWRLTRRGMDIQNAVLLEFMDP